MKKVILILTVFILTNHVYSQINVAVSPVQNNQYQFIDKLTGSKANNFAFDEIEVFVNGFAKVTSNKLWTLADKNGNPISTAKYDAVRNFYNHTAAVKLKDKWGLINEKADIVLPLEYDIIFDFKEKNTVGFKLNKWYLINRDFTVIKTIEVDVFYGFKNGVARFSKNGKEGTMNVDGDVIEMHDVKETITAKTPTQNQFNQSTLSAPCPPNIDFENGNFTNWSCFTGSVSASGTTNNITVTPSLPLATRHEIYSAPFGIDPYGLFSLAPPDGSGKALKIGNNINGAKAERVSYQLTIPAGSTDASITYRYAVVFEDPGHNTYEQPRFSAKLLDVATNTYLPCASYEYVSNTSLPGFFDSPVEDIVKCKNWASVFINLSAYAGKTLKLEFTTADCTRGAHWGYAYVDVGNCNIAADISYQCNPSVATVAAPPGFQFYNWWNNNYTTILATGQNATISPIPPLNSMLHVEVIPFNGYGCRDTLNVLVDNSYPLADAGPDRSICNGNTVSIGSASTAGNVYSWSPGTFLSDPTISNPTANPNVTTTYYLTVTNPASSCPKIDTVSVFVNSKPVAAFTPPASQCLSGNIFTFSNTSAGAASYLWTFGDGNSSNSPNPTHSYATAAAYIVKLVVTSANGCKDSISHTLNVLAAPVALFSIPANQCLAGNNFVFNSSSINAASYYWTFGDGTNSTLANPTHTYSYSSSFTVKLIVTSPSGCVDSVSHSVTVYPAVTASFTTPANQCFAANNFSFISTGTVAAAYHWSFGDGTTSTIINPTHSYATSGIFSIKLVVTSSNGCKDSVSHSVTVFPQPIAVFSSPTSQCMAGNNFAFSNSSTGAASYFWTFGDGTTSTIQQPTHSYLNAGSFTVKLLVSSANGCKDSTTHSVVVYATPQASYIQPVNQCFAANNFTFNNNSTGASSYSWNFGDGSFSSLPNPTHSYLSAGTFSVKLVVTSVNGCKDSVDHDVTVFPQPVSSFSQPLNQCLSGNSFTFNNTSTGAAIYNWNFGDGAFSTLQNPTHSYLSAGAYNVKLVVTSANGCKDSTSKTFDVFLTPVPAFAPSPNQCLTGNNFTFTNNSVGAVSYLWAFGDGASSNLQNPTHMYGSASTYNVQLVVTSANGCTDSISHVIEVFPQPIAAFTPPANQCLRGNNFIFNNGATGAAGYYWSFGDGNTSTLPNPTHIYNTASAFTVKLVVTSINGCKDSISHSINVFADAVASFDQPAGQCLSGNSFTFNNTSTNAAGYMWNFGDGTFSTLPNPTHTFNNASAYVVKLIVTSINGCVDSVTHIVDVFQKPITSFVAPLNQCLAGNNYNFTNNSVGAASYYWTFGDGTSSTLQNPTHSYVIANTFNIQLVITSSNGCKDSLAYPVTIYPNPIPSFDAPANQCLAGNSFTFNNTSTGGTEYLWLFGDGTSSTQLNPTHNYTNSGNYIVKLIITSINGCKDSVSHSFSVFAKPTALFARPADQCLTNNVIVFANNSTGTSQCYWSFGDGNFSAVSNPTHTYATAGSYTVKLMVLNANGCKDSTYHTFVLHESPNINFQNNYSICWGDSIQLNATGAQSYQWSPSQGLSCSGCANPMANPTSNTAYTITALSNFGCITNGIVNIEVKQPIRIRVTPNKATCGRSTTNLLAMGANSYVWSPAYGLNSINIPNPVATPDTTTTYMVVGQDRNNCFKDTNYVKITVNPIPALELGPDVTLNTGTVFPIVPVMVSGSITSWAWSPALNLSCTNCPSPNASVQFDITYRATVKNIFGCTAMDTIRIHTLCKGSQVFVPNAFTPDGDGRNDKLVVRSSGVNAIRSFKIYSRWGELLFEKYNFPPNNPTYGWDGKIKGKTGTAEVYVYILEVTCDNNEHLAFKGNISILN